MENNDFSKFLDTIFNSDGSETKSDGSETKSDASDLNKAAVELKKFFDILIHAGFTEKQAMGLVVGLLCGIVRTGIN